MMLHRHFEGDIDTENMTTTESMTQEDEFVSEVFPPDEDKPRRGRKRKEE